MMNQSEPQIRKQSNFVLLGGILFRPRRTLAYLAYLKDHRTRTWWVPALLTLALTVAPLVAGHSVAGRQMWATGVGMGAPGGPVMVEEGGMVEAPSPPQTPAGPGVFQIAVAIPGTIAAWLIWAAALYLVSVFLGRSSTFGAMFRLAVWSWVPYAVRGLVQTIYILATGNLIVNAGLSGLVLDRSVEQLLPPGPGQLALAGALGRVDIYLIWNAALMIWGLMAFTNLPRRKALTAVLAIWIVLTLLSIIPAIFGGVLGQLGGA